MECRGCIESLSALLDGELSKIESSRIQQHLLQCPSCHEEFRSLRYSWDLVSTVLVEGLEAPSWSGIESHLDPVGSASSRYADWLPAAAVLGLTILSAGAMLTTVGPDAHIERQLSTFVAEREQQSVENQQIAVLEPAGWVSHNPFQPAHAHSDENPFLE